MKKYALVVSGLILYFEKESLRQGEEVSIKRSQVRSWPKDKKAIDKLFRKKTTVKKGELEIRLKVAEKTSDKALEKDPDIYQAFNALV